MFRSNKKQLINILRQDQQIKLDNIILNSNKIVSKNSSSFIQTADIFSSDAAIKIDLLSKNILNSYTSALYTKEDQFISIKSDIDGSFYNEVNLEDDVYIFIPKDSIEHQQDYYKECGIDYIFSPFSVLKQIIKSSKVKNSVNVLSFNNSLYILFLDSNCKISFGKVVNLTPFDKIKESHFYSDEVIGQKLYDEVHFLELEQNLNETIELYYKTNPQTQFVEFINIFYNVKQLQDEQLDALEESLMTKIFYNGILVSDYFNQLVLLQDKEDNSFTHKRVKKTKGSLLGWSLFALLSLTATGYIVYNNILVDTPLDKKVEKTKQVQEPLKSTPKVEKVVVEEKKKIVKEEKSKVEIKETMVSYPNYNLINTHISNQILSLFDLIPNDAVLKEVEVTDNSSTLVCSFLSDSTSLDDMKAKLETIYTSSKVILKHENNVIINTIVSNTGLIKPVDKSIVQNYKKQNELSVAQLITYIKNLTTANSEIKLVSKEKKEFTTYKFEIKSQVKTPKEFFDFISELNKQNYSIALSYPITFSKLIDSIEIKYSIEVYQ